jgi:cyclase
MKQVSANVYVEDQFSAPPNVRGCNTSFITTSEGIVMIDTPRDPSYAMKWKDEIEKKGEVHYIINTDHHTDHVTGNFFYPGIVIAHDAVRELFNAPLDPAMAIDVLTKKTPGAGQDRMKWIHLLAADVDPEGYPLMKNYQLRPPTITFSERLTLYVGEQMFELIYLPGHTRAHIGIYMPREKIFFTGDNFTNKTQPSLADSFPVQWVKSLKKIEMLDIDVVVPGHGVVSDKSEVIQFRLFLEECIKIVKEAIGKGMSKEEMADKISFAGLYPKEQHATPVHNVPEMQRDNVYRFFEMLAK